MIRPFRLSPPATPLVAFDGVDGLGQHCRLDTEDQKALVEAFERAAVDYLDGYTGRLGRCILRQKWAYPVSRFRNVLMLPFPDCREFAIERREPDGTLVSVDAEIVQVGDCIDLTTLPELSGEILLTFWAGWETEADVPASLKQAVRFLVADWFENRPGVATGERVTELPFAVTAMIGPLIHFSV
ncbi:head-tail connector protein [Thalassobius sp. I31.1]|uniref:head-tail connector protein n=1 Tax=Thalassobius sp. I31.1 TaxID=2109912 RepID=UPI000D1B789D|nr:head-tail connector protein [Thalassobius sp. I31.1]